MLVAFKISLFVRSLLINISIALSHKTTFYPNPFTFNFFTIYAKNIPPTFLRIEPDHIKVSVNLQLEQKQDFGGAQTPPISCMFSCQLSDFYVN